MQALIWHRDRKQEHQCARSRGRRCQSAGGTRRQQGPGAWRKQQCIKCCKRPVTITFACPLGVSQGRAHGSWQNMRLNRCMDAAGAPCSGSCGSTIPGLSAHCSSLADVRPTMESLWASCCRHSHAMPPPDPFQLRCMATSQRGHPQHTMRCLLFQGLLGERRGVAAQ